MAVMGALTLVIGIADIVIGAIVCIKFQKRFCDLNPDSISGVTCGKTNFANESYNINYSDIISMNKNSLSQFIIIQTKDGRKVNVVVPGKYMDFVYSTLQQKIMSQS